MHSHGGASHVYNVPGHGHPTTVLGHTLRKSRHPTTPGPAGHHHHAAPVVHKAPPRFTRIHHRPSTPGGHARAHPVRKDSRLEHRGEWDKPEAKDRIKKAEEQQKLEEMSNSHQIEYHLTQKTHFTMDQVEALFKIHKRLISQGKMDRLRFREIMYTILGVTDDLILDRMVASFDGDSQGAVSETEWVLGMNAILRGTLDEQIAYCYEVYDINGDRGIGREELYHFLKNCISPIPGEGLLGIEQDEVAECSRDVAEIAMKKLDVDGNGIISYGDFYNAVQHDPLLLEALGQCLPREKNMKTFLALFADDYTNYSTHYSHPNDIGWDRERDKFNRKKEIAHKLKKDQSKTGVSPLLTYRERKDKQIYGHSSSARVKSRITTSNRKPRFSEAPKPATDS